MHRCLAVTLDLQLLCSAPRIFSTAINEIGLLGRTSYDQRDCVEFNSIRIAYLHDLHGKGDEVRCEGVCA